MTTHGDLVRTTHAKKLLSESANYAGVPSIRFTLSSMGTTRLCTSIHLPPSNARRPRTVRGISANWPTRAGWGRP